MKKIKKINLLILFFYQDRSKSVYVTIFCFKGKNLSKTLNNQQSNTLFTAQSSQCNENKPNYPIRLMKFKYLTLIFVEQTFYLSSDTE